MTEQPALEFGGLLRQLRAGAKLTQEELATGVNTVAFSPDGTLLASADVGGIVQLWDTATRQEASAPITAGTGTGGAVNGVAFSPDGTLLVSADADGTVQTWQVSLFAHPYAALCADVGRRPRRSGPQYAPGEPQPSVCG